MKFEQRSTGLANVHSDGKNIEGYAAVYYDGTPQTEYRLSDKIVERIHPGRSRMFWNLVRKCSGCIITTNHSSSGGVRQVRSS